MYEITHRQKIQNNAFKNKNYFVKGCKYKKLAIHTKSHLLVSNILHLIVTPYRLDVSNFQPVNNQPYYDINP